MPAPGTDPLQLHRYNVEPYPARTFELVLTGETTAEEAARHQPAPDLVGADVAELGEKLSAARRGDDFRRQGLSH